ncbi:MAG: hypothetical protein FJX89_08535 [Bacteroidetes bacterium]|nr:hypothetical protein [Bacteroidota bacterium]
MQKKLLAPIWCVFLLVMVLAASLEGPMRDAGIDVAVVCTGNLLLFLLCLLSYYLHRRGMHASGGVQFLGSVYGAFILRMAVCASAVLAYALWKQPYLSWPAVFVCMFLYLVYTFLETRALLHIQGGRHGKD